MEVIYPVYLSLKGNLVCNCRHHGVGREEGGNQEDKQHDFNERKKKNLQA